MTLSDKGRPCKKCLPENMKDYPKELHLSQCECDCHKQEAPTKQGWEKEFNEFLIFITDEKNYKNGKPVWKGYMYVTVINAIIYYVRSLLRSKDQEAERRVEEAYKKGFNLVLGHMVKHTGEEDGVLYLTQIDWEICKRILKKLLRQEIKKLSLIEGKEGKLKIK